MQNYMQCPHTVRELDIYISMYPHERHKRQQLAAKVARALPDMRRDLSGTTALAKFEAWLMGNGVAIGGAAEPPKPENPGSWLEVFYLAWVILSRWFLMAKVDFKGACRVLVWGVLRL